MTFRQWLRHIVHWIGTFPAWGEDTHLWIGVAGEEYWDCFCGAAHPDADESQGTFRDAILGDGAAEHTDQGEGR